MACGLNPQATGSGRRHKKWNRKPTVGFVQSTLCHEGRHPESRKAAYKRGGSLSKSHGGFRLRGDAHRAGVRGDAMSGPTETPTLCPVSQEVSGLC